MPEVGSGPSTNMAAVVHLGFFRLSHLLRNQRRNYSEIRIWIILNSLMRLPENDPSPSINMVARRKSRLPLYLKLYQYRTLTYATLPSQLAFYVKLHLAVIGPSATLTGR